MSYSTFKTKPRAPYTRPERVTIWPAALTSRANAAIKPIATECTPQPKREYIRSKALLAAVRTLPCQHTGVTGQTEPAHSNWTQHGKGRGIKADDNRVAALSREVHRELDQGKNWTAEQRQTIWWAAHVKTVNALLRAGLWPENVPIPDLRSFDA